MTREIRINLDGEGMGQGAHYADAQAYEAYVERRLREMYPDHDVTVVLALEGQTIAKRVVLDETEHQDVAASLERLWEEFCQDSSLWPSAQVFPPY